MTYDIRDIASLESDTKDLATQNQKAAESATTLDYIINQIKTNWQNEAGTDLASVLEELTKCKEIMETICPTINKFVLTMNTLAADTKNIQSKTM